MELKYSFAKSEPQSPAETGLEHLDDFWSTYIKDIR